MQWQTIMKALIKVKDKEGEDANVELLQVLVLLVLSSSWPTTNIASFQILVCFLLKGELELDRVLARH